MSRRCGKSTGGKFDATLPRPNHKDVAGISFVTPDKDLVSLEELANDPFLGDIGKWYDELASLPGRFKVAAVAYHSDGETYHYAPVLADTDDISEFASMSSEMFGQPTGNSSPKSRTSSRTRCSPPCGWRTMTSTTCGRCCIPAYRRLRRYSQARTRTSSVVAGSPASTPRPAA